MHHLRLSMHQAPTEVFICAKIILFTKLKKGIILHQKTYSGALFVLEIELFSLPFLGKAKIKCFFINSI